MISKKISSSIPYKFVIEKKDDNFTITEFNFPRDISNYAIDMKNIFPKNVRKDMDNIYLQNTLENLKADFEKQAKLYFHK